jgi:hypothetical protein
MALHKQNSYLVGLLCGRGHIYRNDKKIIIEFAHKNPTISGIAHCLKCGWLATERKGDNADKNLFCKNCGSVVPKEVKREYEQKLSTVDSIKGQIIPFLEIFYRECKFDLVGNDYMTYLIIQFPNVDENFDEICDLMNGKGGFDSFEIPAQIWTADMANQTEFVNGMLDTAGFFNAGGWLNRPGNNGAGRMRGYFQIVRNWKMPVQICNILRENFDLPIHTIDWGHPNIRDSKMEDFYNSSPLSWSREHQVKFFPEYYSQFTIRLRHKQLMFEELKSHNELVGFNSEDDCNPPKKVAFKDIKPIHPGEKDKRLPAAVRMHHDKYCQVCSNMGCIFMHRALEESENPNLLYLTGQEGLLNAKEIEKIYLQKSIELAEAIHAKNKVVFEEKVENQQRRLRSNPEQQLYAPLVEYYEKYLIGKYQTPAQVHDTSAFYLDKFIVQNDLIEAFDFCNEFKIKPDIVGFFTDTKKLAFMEVKAGELVLQDLGQLLGYCLVAQPEEAILVSPKAPSLSLVKILTMNSHLLFYGEDKKIEIATWVDGNLEILNY